MYASFINGFIGGIEIDSLNEGNACDVYTGLFHALEDRRDPWLENHSWMATTAYGKCLICLILAYKSTRR